MTDADIRARAIALYDSYTHEGQDRRSFMASLAKLAGGVAAAELLLAGIAADPAAAALTAPDDRRLRISEPRWTGADGRTMRGYRASPARGGNTAPQLLVIHENRGLNAHIKDITRRFALAGFAALAVDFLSPLGGTPADEDKARAMIGALTPEAAVGDAVATLRWLKALPGGRARKVGAVGFCWGGGMVNRIAVAAGDLLDAGVSYYGPGPAPSEASRVKTPLLLQLAGTDARVNATALPWADALRAAKAPVTVHLYEGANHAFNNDTSAERYDAKAAALAWERTVSFLRSNLA